MLSFGVLKDDLRLSYPALEQAFRAGESTLINASPAKDSKTFQRYVKGKMKPRTGEMRLAWALEKSATFAALHRSPLFDLLDLDLNEEDARDQFACWLWRTTIPDQIAARWGGRRPTDERSQRGFKDQMTTFLQAPRHYGEQERNEFNIDKKLTEFRGKCFASTVVDGIDQLHKTSPARAIPAPYQMEPELRRLIELDHPDALCIMLLGVKHPGPMPGIRVLATQGCAIWLTRWHTRYPERVKDMRQFLIELGDKDDSIKHVIAAWERTTVLGSI